MAYSVLEIKDIFVGSLDAKDDMNNKLSEKDFIENFILPPNFDIDDFLFGNKCYIEGYKGTGKTALLHYMSKTKQCINSYSTFMLFKSDYRAKDKEHLENLANNLIKIDKKSLKHETDFEYIWRWIILNKIVEFNNENKYGIFKNNKEWDKFERVIKNLSGKKSRNFFDILPFKIDKVGNMGYAVKLDDSDVIHYLGLQEVEVSNKSIDFNSLLEKAIELFSDLKANDKPAYIFIDELEAFYEKEDIFSRDLRMIRDLLFSVKYFNDLFISLGYKNLKIICAVRTEILESIRGRVASLELNKYIYSFKKELKWNYTNTIAYQHPIIQIWLKRIQMAELKYNQIEMSFPEILDKWFDKKIDSADIIPYILDNCWHKPRDIVRFLQAASNVSPKGIKYSQDVFSRLRKEYSKESWREIYEELNAIYKPEEIEKIKDYLTCFKRYFTYEDAVTRAKLKSLQDKSTFILDNLETILKNLYNVGCLGNLTRDKQYYRWKHKGDESLIIDDSKLFFIVHSGLWSELSLFYIYKESSMVRKLKIGQTVICEVTGINKSHAIVNILDGNCDGSIYIANLGVKGYISDIRNIVTIGDVFKAEIIDLDDRFGFQLKKVVESN